MSEGRKKELPQPFSNVDVNVDVDLMRGFRFRYRFRTGRTSSSAPRMCAMHWVTSRRIRRWTDTWMKGMGWNVPPLPRAEFSRCSMWMRAATYISRMMQRSATPGRSFDKEVFRYSVFSSFNEDENETSCKRIPPLRCNGGISLGYGALYFSMRNTAEVWCLAFSG